MLALLLALLAPPPVADAPCDARHARPATVAQIAREPARWMGACVRVEGTAGWWRTLFENVDGVYARPGDPLNPASNGLRIGLDNSRILKRIGDGFHRATLIGRLQDCETVREQVHASDGPDGFSMVMGYCHSESGPYLWIDRVVSTGPSDFIRQLDTGRPDYGDLVPVAADWPYRARAEGLIERYVAAVRAGDRNQLAEMLFKPDTAGQALGNPMSGTGEHVILRERGDDGTDFYATVCFCRGPHCAGRWPIDRRDSGNSPDHPYVCVSVSDGVNRRDAVEFLGENHGLPEPRKNR